MRFHCPLPAWGGKAGSFVRSFAIVYRFATAMIRGAGEKERKKEDEHVHTAEGIMLPNLRTLEGQHTASWVAVTKLFAPVAPGCYSTLLEGTAEKGVTIYAKTAERMRKTPTQEGHVL